MMRQLTHFFIRNSPMLEKCIAGLSTYAYQTDIQRMRLIIVIERWDKTHTQGMASENNIQGQQSLEKMGHLRDLFFYFQVIDQNLRW